MGNSSNSSSSDRLNNIFEEAVNKSIEEITRCLEVGGRMLEVASGREIKLPNITFGNIEVFHEVFRRMLREGLVIDASPLREAKVFDITIHRVPKKPREDVGTYEEAHDRTS